MKPPVQARRVLDISPYQTFDFPPCSVCSQPWLLGLRVYPSRGSPAVRPRIGSPVTQQVSCRTSGCVSLHILYMPHFARQASGQACRPIIMKASRADTVTCSNFSNER